ncbi:protein HGH1 homolog [Drosophila obscura]|uniref:protein HGH1 homolog n=1 Tax=Drosophila obscura TaxID=7282 RepID=UPI001BB23418|nr:protein HGH1 homolog [Drosophila obscura]
MQLSISRQRSAPSKCLIWPNERSLPWSMVLNNLTRVERFVHEIFDILERGEQTLPRLARAFSPLDFNKMKARLHYLAPIFCNLTQVPSGRELCCHARYHLLEKLLPFASYVENVVRRGGTIGIQKNVCFDSVYHNGILGEDDNTLVAILQPLCGPEEFSEEDSEMLPIEFQMSLPSCTAKKRLSLVLPVTARKQKS